MFHNVFHMRQHVDPSCFHISLVVYLISLWAHHTTFNIQGISFVRKKKPIQKLEGGFQLNDQT